MCRLSLYSMIRMAGAGRHIGIKQISECSHGRMYHLSRRVVWVRRVGQWNTDCRNLTQTAIVLRRDSPGIRVPKGQHYSSLGIMKGRSLITRMQIRYRRSTFVGSPSRPPKHRIRSERPPACFHDDPYSASRPRYISRGIIALINHHQW